ncbi:MAG: hypothetical protein J2P57_02715 [Acidimicrobiaceae bacterium]|nr:hypothetical protein [Acidimicrobiaceae bacterium]
MSELQARTGPQPAAVTFVTTEHFALQSARSSTIAESVGRATMFLASVSGGLVALGLIATAARVGTAFYAFGLVLLPTLSVVGLVTFERTLQSGIEDYGYASRIVRLRAYYLDSAPEVAPYLARVTPDERLASREPRRGGRYWFRTVASMIALITAVLAGSTAGLACAAASSSLAAALTSGIAAGLALLALLMRYQGAAWHLAVQAATAE